MGWSLAGQGRPLELEFLWPYVVQLVQFGSADERTSDSRLIEAIS